MLRFYVEISIVDIEALPTRTSTTMLSKAAAIGAVLSSTTAGTLEEQLEREARKHGVFKCFDAVAAMIKITQRNRKRAEQILISCNSNGRMISIMYSTPTELKFISENGRHTGLLYNGIVRCSIHPSGLPEQQWINDFTSPGIRTVTRTPI